VFVKLPKHSLAAFPHSLVSGFDTAKPTISFATEICSYAQEPPVKAGGVTLSSNILYGIAPVAQ
jgi:hypothetical protein